MLYVDGSRRGPASSAYVYLTWSMAYTLFLVSRNTGMVLTSEGARDPDRLREHAHRAIMLGLRIVVPLAVALAAGAPLLLRVYGTEYAQHATRLLQILALTMIPAAIPVYYVTIARVRQHLSAMVATTLLTTLPALLLGIPLLLKMGIVGIGWSWCIVETTAAIVLLVGPMRQYLFAPSGPVEAVPEAAPRAEVVVETPATIRSSIPIVSALALAAAIGLWIVALTHLDVAKIGKYGLVSALPGAYFGSLVALAAGFVWAVRRNAAPVVYGALTATLVAVLHATPAIEYHALRYAWAWRHVGVVDLMLRHHALVPNTPVLPIYQQWPGFFGAATTFTAAARFPSALSYAAWAPPVFAALDALALVAVFRSFTTDRRRIAIAVWFFVVANWIGQEYFAPQAFDFLLFLCLLAIVLRNYGSASRTFRWEPRALRRLASDHPHERLWVTGPQRRGAAIACLVLMAAIVVSHPLTPLLACMALTALVVTGLIDRVWPAVAMIAITTRSSSSVKPRLFLPLTVGHSVQACFGRHRVHVIHVIARFRRIRRAGIGSQAPGLGRRRFHVRPQGVARNGAQEVDFGPFLGIAGVVHAVHQRLQVRRIARLVGILLDASGIRGLLVGVNAISDRPQGVTQLRLPLALVHELG